MLSLAVLLGGWWLVVSLIFTAGSALAGLIAAAALSAAGTHVWTSLAIILSAPLGDLADRIRWAHCQHGGRSHPGPAALSGLRRDGARRVRRSSVKPEGVSYLAWTITAVMCLALVGAASADRLAAGNKEKFTITAHRAGAAKAPENTLAALRQAIADGADFAEIDVQTTRDGELVILHDGDLARVAGDPRRVAELTLAELRQLDIGRWHGPAFTGERVATLGEMIAARPRPHSAQRRAQVQPHRSIARGESDPTSPQRRRSRPMRDHVAGVFSSPRRQAAAPEVEVGLIVTKSIGDPATTDADFLSLNQNAVSARLLYRAHSRGKEVHVWTVNDRPSMERMVEMGVDSLITDHPDEAAELRE